ncbi:uncharacterized protein LOC128996721 [Macrosteles quadrilineatus]|uniref:uncharacterized protein LOC128996721 n=1 Tax=Macrosteles quadrilineatus TaxID=74068 RepID=UPI0023E17AF4|nr:uncharacterized protein LOC128996721 [Macrosteles quadrilineatus]
MAPIQSEGLKNSKLTVKRLWSKLVKPKEKIKIDKPDDDLVLDSVPDYACNDKTEKETDENSSTRSETSKSEQTIPDTDGGFTKDEEIPQEGEEEKIQEPRRTRQKKPKNSDSPTQIVYNMNVSNGKVHIGDEIVQTYNIQQNYNARIPKKEEKSSEKKKVIKTSQVEAVLQSNVTLESAHIAYLSNHFGKKWRDIGKPLEFSNGDLDIIENKCENDVKKMSFEMLNIWMMRSGDQATVGRLCTKLWNTKLINAREAVKLLADNFSDFN